MNENETTNSSGLNTKEKRSKFRKRAHSDNNHHSPEDIKISKMTTVQHKYIKL